VGVGIQVEFVEYVGCRVVAVVVVVVVVVGGRRLLNLKV
jgi:hypothetical protein